MTDPSKPRRDVFGQERHYFDVQGAAEALGGDAFRALAWGTMTYACHGDLKVRRIGAADGCGFEHRVWLTIGCEGPNELRELKLFVPVPMYCGRCPECGSGMCHVRWREDETFDALQVIPTDAARFSVPMAKDWQTLTAQGYGGADYEDPTGRTFKGEITRAS